MKLKVSIQIGSMPFYGVNLTQIDLKKKNVKIFDPNSIKL
jgi:hypothetical protein